MRRLRPAQLRFRGNTVLDAALVLPILLALAFGTVEFGHYFYIKHCVQGAAREGARAAIPLGATYADMSSAVTNSLHAAGIDVYSIDVRRGATSISSGNFDSIIPGDPVTVRVQVDWSKVGLRPLGIIGDSKVVVGTTVMRKEG